MREEINKGLYWGIGVGVGLSVILLLWISGITVLETLSKDPDWETVKGVEFKVEKFTYRYVNSSSDQDLIITGNVIGESEKLSPDFKTTIWIQATVYNADGIFLQKCYDYELAEYLLKEGHGFQLECRDLTDDTDIGSIDFEVTVKTRPNDS